MAQSNSILTFVQILWGKQYVENYLNYTLPTELSDNNLLFFKDKRATYLILTRNEDAIIIKQHPLYYKLSSLMTVNIFLIDDINIDPLLSKYALLSAYHSIATLILTKLESAAVFLPADGFWGDGSLKKIGELFYDGYHTVFINGPRICEEPAIATVAQFRTSDGIISLSNRELARLTIRTLHPQLQASFWDTQKSLQYPSSFIWKLSDTSLLFRCFHLHPIMVDYPTLLICKDSITKRTIDSEIAAVVFPDDKNMYIITDSDECMVATHTPADELVLYDPLAIPYRNYDSVKSKLQKNNMRFCHCFFATKKILIHSEDIGSTDQNPIINESNQIIWDINNLYYA